MFTQRFGDPYFRSEMPKSCRLYQIEASYYQRLVVKIVVKVAENRGLLLRERKVISITPHVCRHTYCSNQAKAGMNPKTLQYLMGHSDISVTMNVYTHVNFDDAEEELQKMEKLRKAQEEIEKGKEKPVSQKMFKII